jgi:hypothetical protein
VEHAARLARRPTLTAPARADSSEVRIGTKKRALQIEQRNWRRKKCGALPNLLDKKAPYKGPGADSEEKHEPASDIDTVIVDSLKALDPEWPIREADILSRAFSSAVMALRIGRGPQMRRRKFLVLLVGAAATGSNKVKAQRQAPSLRRRREFIGLVGGAAA